MASKQKAEVVAGKSKSSKSNEISSDTEAAELSRDGVEPNTSDSESSSDAPITIESEAVEVETISPDHSAGTGPVSTGSEGAAADTNSETSFSTESPSVTVVDQKRGSGTSILALIFGGVVAGAVGYFGAAISPEPDIPAFDDSQLTEGISANTAALANLENTVSELSAAPVTGPDLSEIERELTKLSQSIDALASDLAGVKADLSDAAMKLQDSATALEERVIALETAVPSAGELATDDELAALRSRIQSMTAEAEARLNAAQAEAAQIAQEATDLQAAAEAEAAKIAAEAEAREAEIEAVAARQEALVSLKAAIETGGGYSDLLGTIGDVPVALSAHAESGVPSLQSLQAEFPVAARMALSQATSVSENASVGERVTAFLKRRTNARSLTPQDGNGPDAILSRAEARLSEGDLISTLRELDGLPENALSALSEWTSKARTRQAALDAIDELTGTN